MRGTIYDLYGPRLPFQAADVASLFKTIEKTEGAALGNEAHIGANLFAARRSSIFVDSFNKEVEAFRLFRGERHHLHAPAHEIPKLTR